MLRRAVGRVVAAGPVRWGGQRLMVQLEGRDGAEPVAAFCLPALSGSVKIGQRVLLNTTAVDLKLGSGGFHFVMACLDDPFAGGGGEAGEEGTGGARASPGSERDRGHIMKLRYTPFQTAVQGAEEEGSPYRDALLSSEQLYDQPVVIGGIHSLLAPAVAGIKARHPEARVAYVMTDGGALPLAWSRVAVTLRERQSLCGCVTCGHAFGGDIEAVNVYSALLAARYALRADVTVVMMGPGIVGTHSPFGHTALEVAQLVDAVAALRGHPIVIPRLSQADDRPRHRGVSHHTLTALGRLSHARATVVLPQLASPFKEEVWQAFAAAGVLQRHRLREEPAPLVAGLGEQWTAWFHSMGRTYRDDPCFFDAALAAGSYAASLIKPLPLEA